MNNSSYHWISTETHNNLTVKKVMFSSVFKKDCDPLFWINKISLVFAFASHLILSEHPSTVENLSYQSSLQLIKTQRYWVA